MDDSHEFKHVDTTAALTLSVGWSSGKRTKLRQIAVGHGVADAFRSVLRSTIKDLESREGQDWAPDADLSPETYLKLSTGDLGQAPMLATEHQPHSLVSALKAAEDLPDMKPIDLPTGDLTLYAITLGDVAGERAVFIRRSNPRRGLKRGRIYSLLSDTLQHIEEPIFAFDEWIDLVVIADNVYVLSQTVFAALFRDQDSLTKQVPQWSSELHEAVPISGAGKDRLEKKALRDSRIRARLEAIVRRGHLHTVSKQALRDAMSLAELDPDALLNTEGEFDLEEEDIAPVLYFLNEDLFTGALTQTSFRADKKATR